MSACQVIGSGVEAESGLCVHYPGDKLKVKATDFMDQDTDQIPRQFKSVDRDGYGTRALGPAGPAWFPDRVHGASRHALASVAGKQCAIPLLRRIARRALNR